MLNTRLFSYIAVASLTFGQLVGCSSSTTLKRLEPKYIEQIIGYENGKSIEPPFYELFTEDGWTYKRYGNDKVELVNEKGTVYGDRGDDRRVDYIICKDSNIDGYTIFLRENLPFHGKNKKPLADLFRSSDKILESFNKIYLEQGTEQTPLDKDEFRLLVP